MNKIHAISDENFKVLVMAINKLAEQMIIYSDNGWHCKVLI